MRTLKEYTELLIKSVRLFSWPVGSIYTSSKSTDPHELFGGTWEPIQDVFLYCAGPKHAAGETGGEETHKLTVEEMPEHAHTATTSSAGDHNHNRGNMNIWGAFPACDMGGREWPEGAAYQITDYGRTVGGGSSGEDIRIGFEAARNWTGVTSTNGSHTHALTTTTSGSGTAHNNMPPYKAVYAWQRVK